MPSLEEIKTKRKLQQQMLAKTLSGNDFKVGDPTAKAYAPVLSQLGLVLADKRLAKQEREAQGKYQKTLADALSPQIIEPATPNDDEGNPMPSSSREKTLQEMAQELMQNQDTAGLGSQLLLKGMDRQDAAKQREHELGLNNQFRSSENELTRRHQMDIARMNNDARADAAATKATRVSPAVQQKITQKMSSISALKMQLQKVKDAFGGIKNTYSAGKFTGGLLPTEKGGDFDKAVAMLSPLARQITRTPGEGAMSDYESRLVQMGLPSRSEHESVTQKQIADWEDMINVLESGYTGLSPDQQVEQPAMLPSAAPKASSGTGLSKDEQSELDQLRKELGRGR